MLDIYISHINVENVFVPVKLTPLGNSDPDMIQLIPVYLQLHIRLIQYLERSRFRQG